MTASAHLLKSGFRPGNGLDRRYCHELWWVTGLNASDAAARWKRSNTDQIVFRVLPFAKGDAHPDPALAGAICTLIQLVSGPWTQSDGTADAIVAATFDSDRRWRSAFQFGTSEKQDDVYQMIPGWAQLTVTGSSSSFIHWEPNEAQFRRPGVLRIEPRDGTNITEAQRGFIYSKVGQPFSLFGIPYLFRAPTITTIKTNQTIIDYRFWTTCPVVAKAAGSIPGIDVPCPALSWLDEYARNPDNATPTIGVKLASSYGTPLNDPTTLPFWGATLI